MKHDPEIQRAVESYQLGLPTTPAAGRSGELLGRGAGNSLEFQEYRQYVPGDDIRHLDWGAFARSDQLMVRLYREEISPRTEILLDASVSMQTGGAMKSRVARQLAAMFALLSGRLGGRPVVVPISDRPPQTFGLDTLEQLTSLPFDGRGNLAELLASNQVPLKKRAVRIVISDFLFPHDPDTLIRRLAAEASGLWVIQLLNAWEAAPAPLAGRHLIDVETGHETDLVLDRAAVNAYLKRLAALQAELLRNCRRAHAAFVTLVAERGLMDLCRHELCATSILRPA